MSSDSYRQSRELASRLRSVVFRSIASWLRVELGPPQRHRRKLAWSERRAEKRLDSPGMRLDGISGFQPFRGDGHDLRSHGRPRWVQGQPSPVNAHVGVRIHGEGEIEGLGEIPTEVI